MWVHPAALCCLRPEMLGWAEGKGSVQETQSPLQPPFFGAQKWIGKWAAEGVLTPDPWESRPHLLRHVSRVCSAAPIFIGYLTGSVTAPSHCLCALRPLLSGVKGDRERRPRIEGSQLPPGRSNPRVHSAVSLEHHTDPTR
jgi:hypothetical protein